MTAQFCFSEKRSCVNDYDRKTFANCSAEIILVWSQSVLRIVLLTQLTQPLITYQLLTRSGREKGKHCQRLFYSGIDRRKEISNQDSPLIPNWRAPYVNNRVVVSVSPALHYFARSVLVLLKVTFVVSFMSRGAGPGDNLSAPGPLDLSFQSQSISVSILTWEFSENKDNFGSNSLEDNKSIRLCLIFESCIKR